MLRIAVNTRLLLNRNMEGIGRFTWELFSRIVKNHPEHHFYFIFDRPFDPTFVVADNVTPIIVFPPVRHPILAKIWFDFTLRRKLKKLNPDLFFSPDAMNSLHPVCKTITVLHDINFEEHPEYFPPLLRNYYRYRTPIIARRSERVVTVSDFSKEAIVKTYGLDEGKVNVVYNAVGSRFHPIEENEKINVRQVYSDGNPYFVFVGGLYYRKNLLNLVKGFEYFKKESGSEMKLLLVGQILKDAAEVMLHSKASPYNSDIIFTGRIEDDNEVVKILASALALTYVSTIEGFGLPLVEAMKCEVPIITSNTTSMPEVGGEAALYSDPFDPIDIGEKMRYMVENESKRKELIVAAKQQHQKFDWDQSAKKTWKIIEEVIGREEKSNA